MADYDVILSFAGEDRAYVAAVAEELRNRGVRVFYDEYERTSLWGKDLYAHLDHVYRKAGRYCVLFISTHYAEKVWTNHERVSAQARALESASEYVLPVRFDSTEIPGLRPTIGYLDLGSLTPVDLADMICEKLELPLADIQSWPKWFEMAYHEGEEPRGIRVRAYQNFVVGSSDRRYIDLVCSILSTLERQARSDGSLVYWTDDRDRRFDRIHVTSSVATALAQVGVPPNYWLRAGADAYLGESRADSIDDRAATIYRLFSGQLTADQSLAFVSALAEVQVSDPASELFGSFLLPQGESASIAKQRWTASPLHSDGASFHACHLADALLHLQGDHAEARTVATTILAGIREHLVRQLRRNEGWLHDIFGKRTPLTLYGFALCRPLAIPLPPNWQKVVGEVMTILDSASRILQCFGLINLAYLHSTARNESVLDGTRKYAIERLSSLATASAAEDSPHESAAALRVLVSGLRLLDERSVQVLWRDVAASVTTGPTLEPET